MKLNADLTMRQLSEVPGAPELFEKYLPGRFSGLLENVQTKNLSVRQIIQYSRGAIPAAIGEKLDAGLKQLHGGQYVTQSEREKSELYRQMSLQPEQPVQAPETHTAFHPGAVWTDTQGKRIHAHGGAILYENGAYYWYGEDKSRTDCTTDVWTWGIRAYRSGDLYNWEDLGLIIPPVLDDPDSPLFPDARIDRPHILHCPKTGKYVCWIHQAGKVSGFLILQADAFCGPYEIVESAYKPEGGNAGDFDLVQDEAGNAYLYWDVNHSTVYGARLTPDYLHVEEKVSEQYAGLRPPFCREGIAVFERSGQKYMLSSGMTGYVPNRSDAAVSAGWEQPFDSVGDPYPEDDSHSSYNSQFTDVFKVPGKQDLYIALSDRWVPDYVVDAGRADIIERVVAAVYAPEQYSVTPEERAVFDASPNLHTAKTVFANYVWLPIRFSDGVPVFTWEDEWKLEDHQ